MKFNSIRALVYACHAAIWFVAVVTVAAEKSQLLKGALVTLSGHHWTSKGIIALALFLAVALVLSNKEDPEDVSGLVRGVLLSAILAALVIFVFYLLHYLGLA